MTMTDQPSGPATRRTAMRDAPRTLAGLWEGSDLRAERVEESWSFQARMRDIAAALDLQAHTGVYEYHPDGNWVPLGRYRTLRHGELVLERLKAATHLVRLAHSMGGDGGTVSIPTQVIPFAEGTKRLIEVGLVEDPESYLDRPATPST
jgi:hypothetical protein